MGEVRRANVADAGELVRLRAVLLAALDGHEPVGDDWRQAAAQTLRTRLVGPDPTLAASWWSAPTAVRVAGLVRTSDPAMRLRLPAPE
ncbi:hypothetical protein AB0J90_35295 [Micromonospora sp. NPDC049523]|uniref:hypothetical protein n=1 Tax=Micromonospora sp. NPDC049523 TaxID=3155921 RepID=UPI00342C99D9